MHICVLHSRYNSRNNSGENLIASLHKIHLQNTEDEFSFVYISNVPEIQNRAKKYLFIFMNLVFSVEAIIKVLRQHKRKRVSVFLIHNIFPNFGLFFFIFLKFLNIPYVIVMHNFRYRCLSGTHELTGSACFKCAKKRIGIAGLIHKCFRKSFFASFFMLLFRQLNRNYIRHAHTVICLSNFAKSELLASYSYTKNIQVLPNFFPASTSPRHDGLKFRTILFAGRLEQSKGIYNLIFNWKKCDLPKNGWKLYICGSGNLDHFLRLTANVDESIIFLGKLDHDEVLNLLQKSSFSVIPSIGTENCPTSIIESYAYSVPVIGPNVGSINEMINETNGIKFDYTSNKLDDVFNEISKMKLSEYERFRAHETWNMLYSPNSVLPRLFSILHEASR